MTNLFHTLTNVYQNTHNYLLRNETKQFHFKKILSSVLRYNCRVHQSKDFVQWNPNGTVSFRNRRRWDFVPERSNGSLSDNITNLNIVAVVSISKNQISLLSSKQMNYCTTVS
jgi:hypothetical protein